MGRGRAERLRQVQVGNRTRARGTDRAGSRQACVGRRVRRPAVDGRYPQPAPAGGSESPLAARTRAKGRHICRLRDVQEPAEGGIYTVSLSAGGWVDVVQDGHLLKPRAFSGATDCDGIRKTVKYEISASPFVLQVSGTKADSISVAILPSD
jgi:hypothetical protein